MTDKEKTAINNLVGMGTSITDISEKLNISRNTVKSYLQRKKTADVCLNCGAVLTHTPHKKKKKFCSDKCRMHYWNTHQNEMSHTSAAIVKCEVCGKDVLSYRKKPRRFCSRECAAKGRSCHE